MRSIRRTLLLSILVALFAVLAIAGYGVRASARSSLRAQHDGSLVRRAQTFAGLVMDDDDELEFDYVGPLGESDLGVLLSVTADGGRVIAQSPDWPADLAAPQTRSSAGGDPVLSDVRLSSESHARMVSVSRHAIEIWDEPGQERPPTPSQFMVLVRVVGRTDALERAEAAVLSALIIGGLIAAAGAAVTVWFGVTFGLRPVRRVSAALDRLGPTDLASPVARQRCPKELLPIVAAVEGLLKRLREAVERERRFTDAAAHELRTPIAELRTITDVAGKWPDEPRLRAAITEARDIADEMEALLVVLLDAARGGEAYKSQRAERITLLPLARQLANGRLPHLHRRGVSFVFEGDDHAAWNGPKGAVLAIVRNLIDNAAEYTPDGGAVRVAAAQNGKGVKFEVENGPVSLGSDEAQRIFEPFWRADKSRSDRSHRGLGLAIVASLADGLHLRRDSAITRERRLRVTLTS